MTVRPLLPRVAGVGRAPEKFAVKGPSEVQIRRGLAHPSTPRPAEASAR